MKLLDDIIASLSGPNPSVTEALLKTKVLLHKLGRKDLVDWVNNELNGYSSEALLPPYRRVSAVVKGNLVNMAYHIGDQVLPVMHLKAEWRNRFCDIGMHQSIAELEKLCEGTGRLTSPIPPEAHRLFEEVITGYHVQRAWSEIGAGQLTSILTQVRSRLLDFVLELSAQASGELTDDDVKQLGSRPETASMFHNAIFGDNATITVGNQNVQTAVNRVERGDFAALAGLLARHDMSESDIDQLKQAITSDAAAPELKERRFGPRVRQWMNTMLRRAAENAWSIELSIAANLLTDALKAYYGWLP